MTTPRLPLLGALAVGVASWTAVEDGRRERRSAPVLLARVATAMGVPADALATVLAPRLRSASCARFCQPWRTSRRAAQSVPNGRVNRAQTRANTTPKAVDRAISANS